MKQIDNFLKKFRDRPRYRPSKKGISILLAVILIVSISVFAILATAADEYDFTNDLTPVTWNIYYMYNGAPVYVIENNDYKNPLPQYTNSITAVASWSVPENKFFDERSAGDYFTIPLPTEFIYIAAGNVGTPMELFVDGVHYGNWEIRAGGPTDWFIHFTLMEDGAERTELHGDFRFYGYTTELPEEKTTFTINGVPIEVQTDNTPLGPGDYPSVTGPRDPITDTEIWKGGEQIAGSDSIVWYLIFSDLNFSNTYISNTPFAKQTGVYIEDILEDGSMTFDGDLTMMAFIYRPNADGELTKTTLMWMDLALLFTDVLEKDTDPDIDILKDGGYGDGVYGFFEDNTRLVIYFGDFPSANYTYQKIYEKFLENNTWLGSTSLEDYLQEYWGATEAEYEKLNEIYGLESPGPGGVICDGLIIAYHTTVNDPDAYEVQNTASYVFDGGREDNSDGKVILTYMDGSIRGPMPGDAVVIKTDADTGTAISGAKFKLQIQGPGPGYAWSDYTPAGEAVTNSYGWATFARLPNGTYRFVEVEAAAGYDINSAAYSGGDGLDGNEFTINVDTDTDPKEVSCTNELLTGTIDIRKEDFTDSSELFRFRLEFDEDSIGSFSPVSLISSDITIKADGAASWTPYTTWLSSNSLTPPNYLSGEIILRDEMTVRIEGLTPGTYRVMEFDADGVYDVNCVICTDWNDPTGIYCPDLETGCTHTGTLDGITYDAVENVHLSDEFDLAADKTARVCFHNFLHEVVISANFTKNVTGTDIPANDYIFEFACYMTNSDRGIHDFAATFEVDPITGIGGIGIKLELTGLRPNTEYVFEIREIGVTIDSVSYQPLPTEWEAYPSSIYLTLTTDSLRIDSDGIVPGSMSWSAGTITNTYTPPGGTPPPTAHTPISLAITKSAENTTTGDPVAMTAGQFSFQLFNSDASGGMGSWRETVINAAGTGTASASFSGIQFTTANTYYLLLKEINSGAAGWTYDDTQYLITVEVDEIADALVVTSVTYGVREGGAGPFTDYADPELAFENKYTPTGGGTPPIYPPTDPTPTPTPTTTPTPEPETTPDSEPETTDNTDTEPEPWIEPDPDPYPYPDPEPQPAPEPPYISGGIDPTLPPMPTIPGGELVMDGDIWVEFDEFGTPLGEWYWDEDEEMWIFDPYPPLGEMPQTGVNSTIPIMILTLGLAAIGAGIALRFGDTRRQKRFYK